MIEHYKNQIDLLLQRSLEALPVLSPRLNQAMTYAVLNGGKRFRPLLLIASGKTLNIADDVLTPAALALELIHCYSLVHDDLPCMDDDDFRRGKPSCHKAFDEATAVLVGDALHALAFEWLVSTPTEAKKIVEMTRRLSSVIGYHGMVGGQALDIEALNQIIDLPRCETIHRYKTGVLIECAVTFAPILSEKILVPLQTFEILGQQLGLAFQIQDDILDFSEDTEEQHAAPNFPAIIGLEASQQRLQNLENTIVASIKSLPHHTMLLEVAQLLFDNNSVSKAMPV